MRQYRTALNHLLQIKGAKKELCKVLKKNINQEVQKLCSNDSVFRSSNISKFSWKSAFKQLENDSPFIVDILSSIAGNNMKQTPRLVSSLGVLLFTRNQQMNSIQSINSVMMFRGHVRTKVLIYKV
jgi:hypothetical protein